MRALFVEAASAQVSLCLDDVLKGEHLAKRKPLTRLGGATAPTLGQDCRGECSANRLRILAKQDSDHLLLAMMSGRRRACLKSMIGWPIRKNKDLVGELCSSRRPPRGIFSSAAVLFFVVVPRLSEMLLGTAWCSPNVGLCFQVGIPPWAVIFFLGGVQELRQ